jgi:hypothetical protein
MVPCGIDRVRWPCSIMPCGTGWMRWPCSIMPCGTERGGGFLWLCRVAQRWWSGPLADCHVALRWGPPVSDLYQGGAHLLTWTNERLPRGTWLLSWSSLVLPRGTSSLFTYFMFSVFLAPSLYPELLSSPSCTQNCLD